MAYHLVACSDDMKAVAMAVSMDGMTVARKVWSWVAPLGGMKVGSLGEYLVGKKDEMMVVSLDDLLVAERADLWDETMAAPLVSSLVVL